MRNLEKIRQDLEESMLEQIIKSTESEIINSIKMGNKEINYFLEHYHNDAILKRLESYLNEANYYYSIEKNAVNTLLHIKF